ncbi:MAG: VRR-NUC domain-containing protein [bacterium]|nr:VRR-NUC domain-containing protein [bacterium]
MIMRTFGSRPGLRLFRNNVGQTVYPNGSRVTYGLCPGSSDLIGFQSVKITADMVGQTIARFVAIEVKGPKTPVAPNQQDFLSIVNAAGGTAVLARSLEDVEGAVD